MNDKSLFDSITQTLNRMKEIFGTEIFNNQSRFLAGVNDLIDAKEKTAKHLLRIAICDLHAYTRLEKSCEMGAIFVVEHLKNEMINDYMIPPNIACGVIDCITVFAGFEPISETPCKIQDEIQEELEIQEETEIKILPKQIISQSTPIQIPRAAMMIPPPSIMSATMQRPRIHDSGIGSGVISSGSYANVGSTIRIGGINWRILEIMGKRALVISEDIIGTKWYHDNDTGTSWANCGLRQYLNGTFYNAFSAREKSRIAKVKINNPKNPWFGTNGGNDSLDNIFLLSIDEVLKYFGDSYQIRKKPTSAGNFDDQYNEGRIAQNTNRKNHWWWLRSPGFSTNRAVFISPTGSFFVYGGIINGGNNTSGGIRPAMWVNI
ncbi:MAG: DUF6273 domain-containing protein [Defluviitaleaceae bacterium]|nr:DUF6273 domain-containing protein [Defluviitaleaceae bacterium]